MKKGRTGGGHVQHDIGLRWMIVVTIMAWRPVPFHEDEGMGMYDTGKACSGRLMGLDAGS